MNEKVSNKRSPHLKHLTTALHSRKVRLCLFMAAIVTLALFLSFSSSTMANGPHERDVLHTLSSDTTSNSTNVESLLAAIHQEIGDIREEVKTLTVAAQTKQQENKPTDGYPMVASFDAKPRQMGVYLIVDELIKELWLAKSPFEFASTRMIDGSYPHTNIREEVIELIVQQQKPHFWLEMGSMLGGSIIKTANAVKRLGESTSIVSVDPFTGDVNMWAWEKKIKDTGKWSFLGLRDGRPTIYDRFLANVRDAGHDDCVVPIVCTSLVGMKLLQRLRTEGRLSRSPDVIYLDSAHEKDETLLELRLAWQLLSPGGVLFGDDWGWQAVRGDVLEFAQTLVVNLDKTTTWSSMLEGAIMEGSVLLYSDQWILLKPE